jgi:hypothetical protein
LPHNRIGGFVQIHRCEAQQPNISADQIVLATVVVYQPITVVAAVIFNRQALLAIEEVWTSQEAALIVIDGNLKLRPRKSGEYQQHTEPGLHWGFGLRFGQINNAPKPFDASGPGMLTDVSAQFADRDQLGVKEHVDGNDSFGQ